MEGQKTIRKRIEMEKRFFLNPVGETIYCRQLLVIKLCSIHDTRFSFLTVRKPYVPGRGERWKRLSLLTGPWLRGLISVSALHFDLSCLYLALK